MPGRRIIPIHRGKANFTPRRFMPFRKAATKMVEKGLNLARLYRRGRYLATVVKDMYGLVNSEKKYFDSSQTNQNILNTGNTYTLCAPAEGTGAVNERNGQKILLKNILIRGSININASATASPVRLMLVVDKMMNGSYPAVTDVLQSASPYSPLDIDDSQGRFVVLYDKLINLNQDGADSYTFKIFKQLNFHQMFRGTTGVEANLGKNYIFLLAISTESTNYPTITYMNRVKYVDN